MTHSMSASPNSLRPFAIASSEQSTAVTAAPAWARAYAFFPSPHPRSRTRSPLQGTCETNRFTSQPGDLPQKHAQREYPSSYPPPDLSSVARCERDCAFFADPIIEALPAGTRAVSMYCRLICSWGHKPPEEINAQKRAEPSDRNMPQRNRCFDWFISSGCGCSHAVAAMSDPLPATVGTRDHCAGIFSNASGRADEAGPSGPSAGLAQHQAPSPKS